MKNSFQFPRDWRETYWGFLLLFLGGFSLLYYFTLFFIGSTAKGGIYVGFLDQHFNYIRWWRNLSIESTAAIIELLGFTVYTNKTQLAVLGRSGFTLVYECLGYGVMSAFTAFVIAFPKPFKSKIVFLFGGLMLIQALNILRFVLLSLFWNRGKSFFGLDQHDLFNITIYLILMIVIYIWINYFDKNESNAAQKSI